MKHAPDIHMGFEFKVENEPWKSFEPHGPQPGQVELMGPPWRPRRWCLSDEGIGLFKRIDEAESHIRAGFIRVMLDRNVDILSRFSAR